MQLEYGHPRVQPGVYGNVLVPVKRLPDAFGVVANVYAAFCQQRIVRRLEGLERLGVGLDAPVPPDELRPEEYADLGNHGVAFPVLGGGYLNGRYQVFPSVRPRNAYRQLAAREYDGFGESVQHETQGRCRICHGVGPVQYHEAVVGVIFLLYQPGQRLPHSRLHVRRVDQRVEGPGVYLCGKLAYFRHFFDYLAEIEGFESLVGGILLHAYGSAGIDQ